MALVPVYFLIDGKPSKALVKHDKTEFYYALGAKDSPEKLKASHGDLGSGEPKSLRFHTLKVKELRTFKEIQDYAFQVTGRLIRESKKGDVDLYQRNAIRLIRRHINGDKSR